MRRLVLVGAAALALAGALGQSAAVAGSGAQYTVSCVGGDTTVVSWQHVKGVDVVTFEWFAAGSTTAFDRLVAPVPPLKPPHGSITTATSIDATGHNPATVSVSIQHGTVTDHASANCS